MFVLSYSEGLHCSPIIKGDFKIIRKQVQTSLFLGVYIYICDVSGHIKLTRHNTWIEGDSICPELTPSAKQGLKEIV